MAETTETPVHDLITDMTAASIEGRASTRRRFARAHRRAIAVDAPPARCLVWRRHASSRSTPSRFAGFLRQPLRSSGHREKEGSRSHVGNRQHRGALSSSSSLRNRRRLSLRARRPHDREVAGRRSSRSVGRRYCLAIAIRQRSSGVIRWSASSASSPRSISTHFTRPVNSVSSGGVVVADRRAAVGPDVGRLVGREEHRHGRVDAALADLGRRRRRASTVPPLPSPPPS